MIDIRRMTQEDFSFAVALTDREGWGYVEEDFERLLSYEPEGCFVAEYEKRPIGLTTTTSYGRIGWIGNVMVEERFRETGVGRRLVQASVEYLMNAGVRTVHLTSYMNIIHFYEGLGFQTEFLISSMSVDTRGFDSSKCGVADEASLNRITALDASFFGGDRSRIIRRMWRDFPRLLLVTEDSLGYVIATCTEKSCEIGPLVVESGSQHAAEQLLRGILSTVSANKARIFVPHANQSALKLVKSLGFEEDFKTMRMRYGKANKKERPEGIFAIGALEKG
ncbi:MAG: GNAT family N-acetyltransferase [Thermoplasmata archaeon]